MAFKTQLAAITVAMDALHIYAALLIQVLAAWLLRRPLSSLWPWLVVLVAEGFNESLDLFDGETASLEPWQIDGAVHDLVNTMVLPTLLLLLVRYAPRLFEPPPPPPSPGD